MTTEALKDNGIEVVSSGVASDKLVKVRATLASVAAQLLFTGKPAPQEMSRFEFSGSQNDKVKAIRELVELAHAEVSVLVTIPNLYLINLKEILPLKVAYKKSLETSSSSSANSVVFVAALPAFTVEDTSLLYDVRIGSTDDAMEDQLSMKEIVALMNKKEKVYLVVSNDCGGKYTTGTIFALKKILKDRSSFWIVGPYPSKDEKQLRFSRFEVQVPVLEEDLTPPLEE